MHLRALLALLLGLTLSTSALARSGSGSHRVIRTYADGRGQTVLLYAGRGTGHRGDWGWLHIKGKHIDGIWYDGGRVTTFGQALGMRDDVQVQECIGTALRQTPVYDRGRRQYRWRPAGASYQVLVVVGADGSIITAYPKR
ncbi:MAG: hypothetical protein EB084_18870 [Proteobacteria bacterium]|nr:hypothetical protein [Pseudomonadota bacterium]